MTAIGSIYTRPLINRTLICSAILYHFQITLICGRTNRPFIPLTLFLLSRPLEQLRKFIRLSNLIAEICFVFSTISATTIYAPTQLPTSISTTSLYFKLLFQITCARRSLNQLSRLRIHSVQDFHIIPNRSRKNVFKTNIVALHDQIHKESLAPLRLFCPRVVIAPDDVTTFVVVSRRKRLLLSQKKRFSSRRVS